MISQVSSFALFSDLCLQGGVPPQPRAAHTCAVLGNKGYIFGGRVLVSIIFLFVMLLMKTYPLNL